MGGVTRAVTYRAGLAADAILGVNFFSSSAPQSFLKFDRAFVCMFRIAAGETWVDELPVVAEGGELNIAFASFLFSFVLIVNWTLLQAVPAFWLVCIISEFGIFGWERCLAYTDALYRTRPLSRVHKRLYPSA